jgi:hypothetical protein
VRLKLKHFSHSVAVGLETARQAGPSALRPRRRAGLHGKPFIESDKRRAVGAFVNRYFGAM